MSTTLWLAENGWVQRCSECDFYPCVPSSEYDPDEPNDCDEFCHDESVDE